MDDGRDNAAQSTFREKDLKRGQFGYESTSDEVAEAFESRIKGSVVVITGISPGGIGADAARAIYSKGPKLLILASRNVKSIEAVVSELAPSGASDIKAVELDLTKQSSARKAAAEVLQLTPVVDALINNAAVMATPEYTATEDGVEWQFATNHLGHFTFTNLIMAALLKSTQGATVVNVSSAGSRNGPVRFDDINFGNGKDYQKFLAYGQSKTANLLFSIGLTQKYGSKGLRSYGVDPGGVKGTNLGRHIGFEEAKAMGWINEDGTLNKEFANLKSVQQGSASYILGAFDPSLADSSGAVLAACTIDETFPEYAKDPGNAEKLWALSEKIVGEKFA